MDIGFIGLGIMGRPMAGHVIRGGHQLHIYSRGKPPPELIEAGAIACGSPREVAERSDAVITMVPDTPDVEAVVFGPDGIAEGFGPGKVLIDMSSISPMATKKFASMLAEKGCEWIDAPVSGGDVGARNATLSIMAGGSKAAFEHVKPVLELMGRNITLVGSAGDGQTAKVANQIIVALTLEAVAEALVFASKAGADPMRVRRALMGGFASSRILEIHGERMIERNFEPGFRVELHQKDINLALQSARELQVSLPNTAGTQELFNACAAHGGAGLDHSAIVTMLELMAGHEIGGSAVKVSRT